MAIGEIGLDGQYPQDVTRKERQREVFQFFLTLAEQYQLSVMIRTRLAIDGVLSLFPSFTLPRVILHRYSGPVEHLRLIKDLLRSQGMISKVYVEYGLFT